jgi:hypothetical protein
MNATVCSSEARISAGAPPATIAQKMQSGVAMVRQPIKARPFVADRPPQRPSDER